MENKFVVLGIHNEKVTTVEGNVARVRFFIGDKVIDDDVELPVVKTFEQLLEEACQTKLKELEVQENV